jgi:arabinan endo-1,5-alpha-L-arabinosidase
VPSSSALQGRICKKPAIPNMPPIRNGSALGDWYTHDPTILKTTDGRYIVYCTLNDLQATDSKDRQNFYSNGSAFPDGLQWAKVWMNGSDSNMWAPDTSYHNGQYWMYYAASTFGSKNSAIGVATSTSGDTATWTDYGEVFNSTNASWNAIDPNLFVDDDGTWYLTFGSWSSGIWQYIMDSKTGFVKNGSKAVQLANGRHDGIEASGLFKKGNAVYKFMVI